MPFHINTYRLMPVKRHMNPLLHRVTQNLVTHLIHNSLNKSKSYYCVEKMYSVVLSNFTICILRNRFMCVQMFNMIIKIEEASNPIFLNTQDGAAKEVVDVAPVKEKLMNELLSESKWIPIMSIKKGKVSTLISYIQSTFKQV